MISEEFAELNDFLSLLAFTGTYQTQWGKRDYSRKYDAIDMFNIKQGDMDGYDIKFYMDQYKKLYIEIGYYVTDKSSALCPEIYLESEKIILVNPMVVAPFLEQLACVASRSFQLQVPDFILTEYRELVTDILKEEALPEEWSVSIGENNMVQVSHKYEEEKNFRLRLPEEISSEKLGMFEIHVDLSGYMCRFVMFKSPSENLPLLAKHAKKPVFNNISVKSEKKKLARICHTIGHMPSPAIQKIYQYVMLEHNLSRNTPTRSTLKI